MQVIPISPVQSQTLTVTLAGQNCKINLYQKSTGMFLDLYLNNIPIVVCMLCPDRVGLIRHGYLGFFGSLAFCDTQGLNAPTFDGLGSRYLLNYLEATEI